MLLNLVLPFDTLSKKLNHFFHIIALGSFENFYHIPAKTFLHQANQFQSLYIF